MILVAGRARHRDRDAALTVPALDGARFAIFCGNDHARPAAARQASPLLFGCIGVEITIRIGTRSPISDIGREFVASMLKPRGQHAVVHEHPRVLADIDARLDALLVFR